ncbi:MAG TPA: SPOR domain-containing protein, partial [Alphaproteobacteria bacterium]|nr:SPOR domain-containing protein [Alphaproteobacteria bacterium]
SMASGSYRVQLAALRSEAAADTEWKKLQKSFPDLLSSLSPNVVKVDLQGKGTFYRLQAGGLSESAAKDLCEELKRRKAECIVVKS